MYSLLLMPQSTSVLAQSGCLDPQNCVHASAWQLSVKGCIQLAVITRISCGEAGLPKGAQRITNHPTRLQGRSVQQKVNLQLPSVLAPKCQFAFCRILVAISNGTFRSPRECQLPTLRPMLHQPLTYLVINISPKLEFKILTDC